MTNPAIATQVHQSLDVHGHFTAQITFDGELADLRAKCRDFGVRQIFHECRRADTCAFTRLFSLRATHAEDGRESDHDVFVHRNVDAGDAGHCGHSPRRKARNCKLKTLSSQCFKDYEISPDAAYDAHLSR
jgi:hypothetical protein